MQATLGEHSAALQSETPVKLRSYQQEMLEHALEENVIIVMDTGSGKTHVAIRRIAEQLQTKREDEHDQDKIVWFMCPSVALCLQQHEVLGQHLPGYLIKTLNGSDGVDRWTTQELWSGFLKNVRVVVCTPKVLEDALTHGFVKITNISLLVFDEAHRCIGNSPMNIIMRNFYHPAKAAGRRLIPHILGLTASPIMSAKSSSLGTIEANLNAKAMTPKIHRSELEKYVHPPNILRISFGQSDNRLGKPSTLSSELHRVVDSYDVLTDAYLKHLGEIDQDAYYAEVQRQLVKPSTRTYKQLKVLSQRAIHLNEQLGNSACDWFVRTCIRRNTQAVVCPPAIIPDLAEQERYHLRSILLGIIKKCQPALETDDGPLRTSPKARALIHLLEQAGSPTARGIVFVEQRATVVALAYLLRSNESVRSTWSIGAFVGTSSYAGRNDSLTDLIDLKEQQQDLADFRNGTKNLIISTSVLEEGIDVSACNLVVCFDLPNNLVSFIQRRGRARQQHSTYAMFISAIAHQADPSTWERLEDQMKQAYMDESRTSGVTDEAEEDEDSNDREYRIQETGALLTHANARAHLHHFCAVSSLHASRHVDLRPEFVTKNDGGKTPWTAHVILPSFVHRSLRTASSSQAYSREETAIKDASFEAYVALHRNGLVNDNLLPLREDPQFTFVNQPSIIDVAERQSPWRHLFGDIDREKLHWHAASLKVTSSGRMLVSVTMWLPSTVPAIPPFKLYWNEDTTYIVQVEDLQHRPLLDSDAALASIRLFTHTMLQSVFKAHMTEQSDFPILFSPDCRDGDIDKAVIPPSEERKPPPQKPCCYQTDAESCGLVRVRSEYNRPFLFSSVKCNHDGSESEIEVTAFPKRKDFLHPLVESNTKNAAYSATYSFPASDCEFDDLPAKYAKLAAFVPSILHKIEVGLVARDLQSTVLSQVDIKNPSLVVEAISSPSSSEGADYNRLEFLGDTILKFCASLQIMAQHLNWPEGYLTYGKGVLVSNNYLTKSALDAGLDRYILTKTFTGRKWRPQMIDDLLQANSEGDKRSISSKVVADVVEALIGASYVDGGLEKALNCIRTLLPDQEWYTYGASLDRLLSEVTVTKTLDLQQLERLIGYTFTHKSILLEAITHASLPHHPGYSYERLEFLGDAVLDLIIVPKIFAHHRKVRHWELHRIRDALANRDFLGYCCMRYGIEEERQDVVFEKSQTGREVPLLTSTTREIHLHDFIRADSDFIYSKQRSLQPFRKYRDSIEQGLEAGKEYPWPDLIAMRPQKVFSDLVEAVLGALFLDSRGDLGVCEAFVEKLGIFKIMNRILDENVETTSPKERAGILAGNQTVEYVVGSSVSEEDGGKMAFSCVFKLDDVDVADVAGCASKEEAEARAALKAVKVLTAGRMEDVRLGAASMTKKRKLDIEADDDEIASEDGGVDLDLEYEG